MRLSPNHVSILDAGLSSDHHSHPPRVLFSKDGNETITTDELLWYIARDPGGIDGFLEQNGDILPSLNGIVLAILKLDSRHFDSNGKLQVNIENRPYGYSIHSFGQTIPGRLIRNVRRSLSEAFGNSLS